MMIVPKKDIVNTLLCKDNVQPADVSMDNVVEILENFKITFEIDMANSDIEKYIEKYSIESPFYEITDSANNSSDRPVKSLFNKKVNSKWDVVNRFSRKYIIALEKTLKETSCDETQENQTTGTEEEENVVWEAADEEWKKKVKEMIENERKVNVTWPEGFCDTIQRCYAIQGLKKKMPWITISKATTKTASDRFKKGRRKESLRNNVIPSLLVLEDEVLEPPPWEEIEKMRQKCIDWLDASENVKINENTD